MHVHVVNLSTLVSDDQVRAMVKAVSAQVRGEFREAWERSHDAVHFAKPADLEKTAERVIAIVNAPPQGEEGVLGEHTELLGDQVRGYVYCAPVLDAGGGVLDVPEGGPRGCAISAVLSHEVLELLGNPNVNRWADDDLGDSIALEMCDPCEADAYLVGDVLVSDFVLPSYFDPQAERPFSHLDSITVAFGLAPEGYQIVRDAGTNERSTWGEIAEWRKHGKASVLSRTSRLCRKSKVEAVLERIAPPILDLEDPAPATTKAAPPAAPKKPAKPVSRVKVGLGARKPETKPARRVKIG
jgi:hypothetical protein